MSETRSAAMSPSRRNPILYVRSLLRAGLTGSRINRSQHRVRCSVSDQEPSPFRLGSLNYPVEAGVPAAASSSPEVSHRKHDVALRASGAAATISSIGSLSPFCRSFSREARTSVSIRSAARVSRCSVTGAWRE